MGNSRVHELPETFVSIQEVTKKMNNLKKHLSTVKKDTKRLLSKKNGRDINVSSPVGDDKPEADTSNLIQIGNQVGYPQESITYKQFQEKVRRSFLG